MSRMWTRTYREGPDGVLAAIEELVSKGIPVPPVLAIRAQAVPGQ